MDETLPAERGCAREFKRDDDFVLALLTELRRDGYRPAGWARFFGRSWARSRTVAREHPGLVASWRRLTIGMMAGEALALGLEAALGDAEGARRALPGTALCLAWAQLDAYAHLALHQPARGAPLFAEVGLPNALTQTRRAAAGVLWGHLWGGRPAKTATVAAALAVAGATDVADGLLARRLGASSRLGQYLDGTADFSVGLSLALTLAARGALSPWLASLLVARWALSPAYAVGSYFGRVRRSPLGSTTVGKAASVAQAAVLALGVLPAGAQRRLGQARAPLVVAAGALFVAAPLAQAWRALHTPSAM